MGNDAMFYLWSLLLLQARIDGMFHLVFYAFNVGGIYATVRLCLWGIKKVEAGSGKIAYSVCGIASAACLIVTIANACTVDTTITAFTNPGAWVLHRILPIVKVAKPKDTIDIATDEDISMIGKIKTSDEALKIYISIPIKTNTRKLRALVWDKYTELLVLELQTWMKEMK
ncbi:MAG: hypothetical protein A2Z57_13205 [Planctomycetes bacterium RIFCSPHIGHO2_12_39_6]|nr:MAG: hypothetical protein A2Z57_13205 [Planctomycetes bacterium RIFCSPHIGHO2_12_39_6]OHB97612.1 MAG: hypothetical protein A2W74_01800 [Planctomycetes bacterium RIFCSPLOWO2_12_38_17]